MIRGKSPEEKSPYFEAPGDRISPAGYSLYSDDRDDRRIF